MKPDIQNIIILAKNRYPFLSHFEAPEIIDRDLTTLTDDEGLDLIQNLSTDISFEAEALDEPEDLDPRLAIFQGHLDKVYRTHRPQ